MRAVSSGKCEPFCSGDAARNDVDIAQQRNESRFQKVFQMREQCQVNPRDNVAARTACSDDANRWFGHFLHRCANSLLFHHQFRCYVCLTHIAQGIPAGVSSIKTIASSPRIMQNAYKYASAPAPCQHLRARIALRRATAPQPIFPRQSRCCQNCYRQCRRTLRQ